MMSSCSKSRSVSSRRIRLMVASLTIQISPALLGSLWRLLLAFCLAGVTLASYIYRHEKRMTRMTQDRFYLSTMIDVEELRASKNKTNGYNSVTGAEIKELNSLNARRTREETE